MKQHALVAALWVPALCVGMAGYANRHAPPAAQAAPPPPTQVPPQGFPRTPEQMQALLHASTDTEVRQDAWQVLADLTKGGTPHWESEYWDTKCTLDLTPSVTLCKQYGLESAKQMPVSAKALRPVSSIFYNVYAADGIRANHLDTGQTLAGMIQAGDAGIPAKDFKPGSIVVKTIWEGFNDDTQGPVSLHVYNHANVPAINGSLPGISAWKNTIALKLKGGQVDRDTPCDAVGRDYATEESGTPDPVPLQCFYSHSSGGQACYTIAVLTSVSPVKGPSLGAARPCTLVLVGAQIITNEVPQWTWSTFWWTNVYHDWKAEDKPPNLAPAFSHFAMDTMIGSANPAYQPMFNPYLEGPQKGGVSSNCLQCHSSAAFMPFCPPQSCPHDLGSRIGITSPEALAGHPLKHCSAGDPNIAADHCQLQTSFLWSIATNQDRCTTETQLLPTPQLRARQRVSKSSTAPPCAPRPAVASR